MLAPSCSWTASSTSWHWLCCRGSRSLPCRTTGVLYVALSEKLSLNCGILHRSFQTLHTRLAPLISSLTLPHCRFCLTRCAIYLSIYSLTYRAICYLFSGLITVQYNYMFILCDVFMFALLKEQLSHFVVHL